MKKWKLFMAKMENLFSKIDKIFENSQLERKIYIEKNINRKKNIGFTEKLRKRGFAPISGYFIFFIAKTLGQNQLDKEE